MFVPASKKTFVITDYTDFEIIESHRLEACTTKFHPFGGIGVLPVPGNMLCFLLVLGQYDIINKPCLSDPNRYGNHAATARLRCILKGFRMDN